MFEKVTFVKESEALAIITTGLPLGLFVTSHSPWKKWTEICNKTGQACTNVFDNITDAIMWLDYVTLDDYLHNGRYDMSDWLKRDFMSDWLKRDLMYGPTC